MQDDLFVGLAAEMAEAASILNHADVMASIPPTILRSNLSMSAAYALCIDGLYSGATAYAAAFEPAGVLPTARHLYALFQAANDAPGADLNLVDAWAAELGLTGWYGWTVDDTMLPPPVSAGSPAPERPGHRLPPAVAARQEGGATNPDYFADPGAQMAASMYMLDALRRFAHMDRQQIRQIAAEVAIIGKDGITYGGDKKVTYTLKSLPGEEFSGLEMLCLEYVGFKLVAPELDLRIPLDEAYRMAVQMYESGM